MKVEDIKQDDADHYFCTEEWDCTYDKSCVDVLFDALSADVGCSEIVEIGRLRVLPSKFWVETYNEEKDEYEQHLCDTKEEAEKILKQTTTQEASE